MIVSFLVCNLFLMWRMGNLSVVLYNFSNLTQLNPPKQIEIQMMTTCKSAIGFLRQAKCLLLNFFKHSSGWSNKATTLSLVIFQVPSLIQAPVCPPQKLCIALFLLPLQLKKNNIMGFIFVLLTHNV